MGEINFEDRHYKEAVARGAEERSKQPAAISARYDAASGRIVVEFENGAVTRLSHYRNIRVFEEMLAR